MVQEAPEGGEEMKEDPEYHVLSEVQAVFIAKIMTKNSWGKNEVIEAWKDACLAVLMEKITTS